MTQHEFVSIYVAVPLIVAVGWLVWRARTLLRGLALYALAIAALLAVVRLGVLAHDVWQHAVRGGKPATYASCISAEARMQGRPKDSCWT
jgi:hypothetical protein